MKKYQEDYAEGRRQMYEHSSRVEKGVRIVKLLKDYFKNKNLNNLNVLDVGSSTGIIDNEISKSIKNLTGIDIDKKAVEYANKKYKKENLKFEIEDAMNLKYKNGSYDIVICSQVYEHVSNPQKLMNEIYRVLKPGGVCYFAAINRFWPMEVHYNLPFLSYLPKKMANIYIKIFRNKDEYWENPLSYWQLKTLVKKFKMVDYTPEILNKPKKFGYKNPAIPLFLSKTLKYFTPTFFWILIKEEEN